jgi:hypothetical protein
MPAATPRFGHAGGMARILTPLLDTADFPLAELCAARLDGELYAVDDCFAPVDEADTMHLRAAALWREMPSRVIAERASALWVFGVLDAPPNRHTLCISLATRARVSRSSRWLVRERVLAPSDVQQIGGMSVVTPLRAAVDILTAEGPYGAEQRRCVLELMALGGFGAEHCMARLYARPSTPGTRAARQRLEAA